MQKNEEEKEEERMQSNYNNNELEQKFVIENWNQN